MSRFYLSPPQQATSSKDSPPICLIWEIADGQHPKVEVGKSKQGETDVVERILRNAVCLGPGAERRAVELGRSWVFWTCHQLPARWEFTVDGRVSRK